jgi:hypothetical protein
MAIQAKVDDVADAQCVDISQLRFGRLTGCGYPVIEPTPIVNASGSAITRSIPASAEDPGEALG